MRRSSVLIATMFLCLMAKAPADTPKGDYEQQASTAIAAHDYPAAIDALEHAIEVDPTKDAGFQRLDEVCRATHSFQPALLFLRKQLKDHPSNTPLSLITGTAVVESSWADDLATNDHVREAIPHVWNAYHLLNGRLPVGSAYTMHQLSGFYNRIGDYRQAIACGMSCRKIGTQISNPQYIGYGCADVAYVYSTTSVYRAGIGWAEQAALAFAQAKDKSHEVALIQLEASLCQNCGDAENELRCLNRAFKIAQTADGLTVYRAALSLADCYSNRHEYSRAVPIYQAVISSAHDDKRWDMHSRGLIGLASAYVVEERVDEAVPLLREALSDDEKWTVDRVTLLDDRTALARALIQLGQTGEALKMLEADLHDATETKDGPAIYETLEMIGGVYEKLGDYNKAIQYERRAIDTQPSSSITQIYDAGALASLYNMAGDFKSAAKWDRSAIDASRRFGDAHGAFVCSSDLAMMQADDGKIEDAINTINQPILEFPNTKIDYVPRVYGLLMTLEGKQGRLALATILGKQAILAWQTQREYLGPLGKDTQDRAFVHAVGTYRTLIGYLLKQNRVDEALQVYNLMKRKEFQEFTNSKAESAWPIPLNTQEKAVFARRQKLILDCAAKEKADRDLRERKREADLGVAPFNSNDRKALKAADTAVILAKSAFAKFMTDVEKNFGARLTPTPKRHLDRQTSIEGGTVVLYTLVTDGAVYVIALDKGAYTWTSTKISHVNLAKKISAFREAIQDPTIDISRPATDLYNLLVKPIEPFLQQRHATRLLWSLDGALRYCPMAALYDGKRYLIERYACEEFTVDKPASKPNVNAVDNQALGLGVTKPHAGFEALPNVAEELSGLIHSQGSTGGLIDGMTMLDDNFTRDSMVAALKSGKYRTVHIASHFQFETGDDTKSFLLLGDGGHFSLADMKSMPHLFSHVDMLTLSACQTAVGSTRADGREIDGCAVIAQHDGANTVVASLWPIADASTPLLMHSFYQLRRDHPALSKSEALREAQLSLLRGTATTTSTPIAHTRGGSTDTPSAEDDVADLPDFHGDQTKPFAHPYYWAPFVLIGKWQ